MPVNADILALFLSAVALLVTKAMDVHSTWRHVGIEGEMNPLVSRCFRRFGLARGLWLASLVYVTVLALEFGLVGWMRHRLLTWGTVSLSALIAWVQWDVARFNRTRCHSLATRWILRAYIAWHRVMERLAPRDPA